MTGPIAYAFVASGGAGWDDVGSFGCYAKMTAEDGNAAPIV
jgi:hypothetical protein